MYFVLVVFVVVVVIKAVVLIFLMRLWTDLIKIAWSKAKPITIRKRLESKAAAKMAIVFVSNQSESNLFPSFFDTHNWLAITQYSLIG